MSNTEISLPTSATSLAHTISTNAPGTPTNLSNLSVDRPISTRLTSDKTVIRVAPRSLDSTDANTSTK